MTTREGLSLHRALFNFEFAAQRLRELQLSPLLADRIAMFWALRLEGINLEKSTKAVDRMFPAPPFTDNH